MGILETEIEIPAEHERNVFGQFDVFAKKIERTLHVTLIARDGKVKILGDERNVERAERTLTQLTELSRRGNVIQEQNVDYTLSLTMDDSTESVLEIDKDLICYTLQGKPIKPKTLGQKKYVDAIREDMITFGLGPAGTGKTYLAMAMAITAFKQNEVGRIILTRPAIEAGEKLGFLPGDLQSKIDPYLRPLYDALYQIMGAESFQKNSEKGLIEVAPLAYMRGRTLDNAFIILDEAQNTTPAQMKMFLTRIGFGSKVVITGDATQKDLAPGVKSGLDVALRVLKNIEDIGICYLTSQDVVRHPLVQKIVQAYEVYEQKSQKRNTKTNQKDKEGKTFKTYSTTINSKQEDGTFISVSVPVRITKTALPKGSDSKLVPGFYYTAQVRDGFLSAYNRKTKEGTERAIMIVLTNLVWKDKVELKTKPANEEDVPF